MQEFIIEDKVKIMAPEGLLKDVQNTLWVYDILI